MLAWSRKSYLEQAEIAPYVCALFYLRMWDARSVQIVISMYLMRIKGRRQVEFKIFLRDLKDGNIILRSSARC